MPESAARASPSRPLGISSSNSAPAAPGVPSRVEERIGAERQFSRPSDVAVAGARGDAIGTGAEYWAVIGEMNERAGAARRARRGPITALEAGIRFLPSTLPIDAAEAEHSAGWPAGSMLVLPHGGRPASAAALAGAAGLEVELADGSLDVIVD